CSRSSAHWRPRTGTSCGGGRRDGGSASVQSSSVLLRDRGFSIVTRPARGTVVAIATAVAAVEAIAAVEAAATTIVAVAITVGLAHHRRGAFLMRLDAHRDVAQHVLIG